jgi:sporulation protein YlmC with PRC-barrel domain
MRAIGIVLISGLAMASSAMLQAQVAGSTLLAVSVTESREVADGWSARRQILGRAVFNDQNERIGAVDDLIIAPDKSVTYAIIGGGGFLGVARRNVAIRVNQLKVEGDKLVLPGATKEAHKEAPEFEYAR